MMVAACAGISVSCSPLEVVMVFQEKSASVTSMGREVMLSASSFCRASEKSL